ncbi:MAG: hypothetical protein JHC95_19120 [Solirubrobacteraceae bacterium]|nr:hypothetical protein [Solirubrobacteraceae bacterium]
MRRTGWAAVVAGCALMAHAGTAGAAPIDAVAEEDYSIFTNWPTVGTLIGNTNPQPVGDINGDGLDDVVLSTTRSADASTPFSFQPRVVFGRRGVRTDIDLTALGGRGFQIVASGSRGIGGVKPAGDLNGDGRDDLVVTLSTSGEDAPRSRVVLGTAATSTIDVDALGSKGFVAPDDVLLPGAGRGDINGDGYDDALALRVLDWSTNDFRPLVFYGGPALAGASASAINTRLVTFTGPSPAAILGDVNDDGIDDVAAGFDAETSGGASTGAVVFGRRVWGPGATNDMTSAPRLQLKVGYRWGQEPWTPYPAGDVNGDGKVDIAVPILGSWDGMTGEIQVVFGRGAGSLDLDQLGSAGLRLTGFTAADYGDPGLLSPVGDFDGDGRDELAATGGRVPSQLVSGRTQGGTIDVAHPNQTTQRTLVGAGGSPTLFGPVGDLDGDGAGDLAAVPDDNDPPRLAVIAGSDRIAPTVTGFGLSATTFRTGATPTSVPLGTTVRGTLSEDVTLQLSLRKADGTKLATLKIPVRRGARSFFFDGKVNGVPLAPGQYQLIPVPTDAAGNQSVGTIARFTVVR